MYARQNSHYWFSRDGEGLNLQDCREVEVRLDIDPQSVSRFKAPDGWKIVHTKPNGMVFMRRTRPLTDGAIKAMFVEVLTIAVAHNATFHSWMHARDLDDW